MAIVVSNLDEIETIAKYARQMSKYNPSLDVFVFNEHLKYLGRVCYRKECPTLSVDCSVPRCGEPPHLMVIHGFKYNAKKFSSRRRLLMCFGRLLVKAAYFHAKKN